MKCPACDRELQQVTVSDITVDVCKNGCGGIWFDNFELEKVDEPHEAAGEALLDIEIDPSIKIDFSKTRTCPKCEGQKMIKHFASVKHQVELDECPSCGGIWLDKGELSKIRSQFTTEEERKEALRTYLDKAIGPELARMRAENEQQLQKAKKVVRMFRFICPSYYIPGKQEWGAF